MMKILTLAFSLYCIFFPCSLVAMETRPMRAECLMLPKSAALDRFWGASKQNDFGELSYLFIDMGRQKLKNNEFKNIIELEEYFALARKVIGSILAHHESIGQKRSQGAYTPINNSAGSRYPEQFAEFTSMADILMGANNSIVLYHEATNKKIKRSEIFRDKDAFKIHHVDPSSFADILQLANDAFIELTAADKNNLNEAAKRKLINKIYFYMLDAMTCDRGSMASAEMMYHALEGFFLGRYTYLGEIASSFGHEQGVMPDLLAMLSPTFENFDSYFSQNILAKNELTLVIENESISVEQIPLEIKIFINELEKYQNYLVKNNQIMFSSYPAKNKILMTKRLDRLRQMIFAAEYIEQLSANYKKHAQKMLHTFLAKFYDDKLLYPGFFWGNFGRSIDLKAPILKSFAFDTIDERNEALAAFSQVMAKMKELMEIIGAGFGRDKCTTYHWSMTLDCRTLGFLAKEAILYEKEHPEVVFGVMNNIADSNFAVALKEFLDIIDRLSTRSEDAEKTINEVADSIFNSQPSQKFAQRSKKMLVDLLTDFYNDSEILKQIKAAFVILDLFK
jgi:hypothetical protein